MDEVPFNGLGSADLAIDRLYKGGTAGNASDDPISKLLDVGNQGGFRYAGSASTGPKYVVLFSSLSDPDWPDSLDETTGLFTYYGDNKSPGSSLHERKGNLLLKKVFDNLHAHKRSSIPPFFVFTKGRRGRDVIFRGLAVPGAKGVPPTEDLIAIWKSKHSQRFQNYKAIFTILDANPIPRSWINDLADGNVFTDNCPRPWKAWVNEGNYRALKAGRTVEYRKKSEQLPATEGGSEVIDLIYRHFKDDPLKFEKFAAEIFRLMDSNVAQYDLTRPRKDGGRDAIGKYQIGYSENSIKVDFAIEAKCFRDSSIGVKHTSRLISRLRNRQFGVLVTTSYVSIQAYREIIDDEHPVVIISASDIVNILSRNGYNTKGKVKKWLKKDFQNHRGY